MKLLVLDGNSILNRAFYGIKLLSTGQGEFTNGIFGFLSMLSKLLSETEPDAVAVAFDMRAPTFRHKAYTEYKAKRKGMPDELAQQMPVLKELLADLGYRIVTCEGYEADDILGTLAAACERDGHTCIIATGDRDSLQLVSAQTTVRLATTKFGQAQVTLYDEAKIHEDYGVSPKQLIDIKAIQGDASDNIPGVAGIGEKGAGELIRSFGSLQRIYDELEQLDIKPKMKEKLLASRENAFMSYELGTICCKAPIETDVSYYRINQGNPAAAAETMIRLELFSMLEKYNSSGSAAPAAAQEPADQPPVYALADGAGVLARVMDCGEAYFISEYSSDGLLERLTFYLEGKHGGLFTFKPSASFLLAFLGRKDVKKYTHDSKLLHKSALSVGLPQAEAICMDSILAAYLLNPSASGYDIPRLAAQYSIASPGFDEDHLNSAYMLPNLCAAMTRDIEKNGQQALLETIEIPLAAVLAQMEHIGFYVDRDGISAYGKELQQEIDQLTAFITEQVGYAFNINSPKQLGKALFDDLGLPHGKKTKSGWSTNADVLESLRMLHPVVDAVLRYRTLSKLKSTYCDGLVKVISTDGRIHSNFNQTETRTGRISSTEPNLQNIPVRTPVGKELRKFFAAETGVLVDADYSQIELRVLAHVAHDDVMLEDFRAGRDIHSATAARVFGVPQELVTSEMRSKAKAVNFGIVYGIGAFSLSQDIGVSVKEADMYIKEYLRNYSGIDQYMKDTVEKAKESGFVETIFGRRRYLPELKSSNYNMRSFGERVARNMPIQGAAADIIKIAMIRVAKRLSAEGRKSRLILQVHDELIVEAYDDEADAVQRLLVEEMEAAVALSVPLKADSSSGKTWYIAKS